MSPCPNTESLICFHEGRSTPIERQEILQHLDECGECRAFLAWRDRQATQAEPVSGHDESLSLSMGQVIAERPEHAEDLVGQVLQGYQVLRLIGEGGMGAVYEAKHERFGGRAAIKVMFPKFSSDRRFVSRFHQEARLASAVEHPGLAKIYNHGDTPAGTAYIIMEFLQGESLSNRLRALHAADQRLSVADVYRLGQQVVSALCAVHQRGIIHRDLKPANVMIVPDPDMPAGERAKVVDFGIAKLVVDVEDPLGEHVKTGSGAQMGTPPYMAPEQCGGAGEVTARADVYSLGIMLYQMLAGVLPFIGPPQAVMGMHLFKEPPSLKVAAPGLPKSLYELIQQMLAKDPATRPTMEEVKARLVLREEPRRRWAAWLSAGSAFMIIGVILLLGSVMGARFGRSPPPPAKTLLEKPVQRVDPGSAPTPEKPGPPVAPVQKPPTDNAHPTGPTRPLLQVAPPKPPTPSSSLTRRRRGVQVKKTPSKPKTANNTPPPLEINHDDIIKLELRKSIEADRKRREASRGGSESQVTKEPGK